MSQEDTKKKKLEFNNPSPTRQPLSGTTLNESLSTPTKPLSSSGSTTLSPNTEEFTSPTKSLKSFFFKNRLSSYSIDSINEEPELENESNVGTDLTPTKSPRFSFNLRPKFIRSRSSGLGSESSSLPQPYPILLPQQNYLKQKASVDDFADTESDESNENVEKQYDAESIDSILQEYEKETQPVNKKDFVFQEEFDETSIRESRPTSVQLTNEETEELKNEIITHGSVRSNTMLKRLSHNSPKSENIEEHRLSAGDSILSSTSLRYKIHKNKVEPINSNKRNSLRASVAFSDDSETTNQGTPTQPTYPDPTITPLATPRKTFNETPSSHNTNRTSNSSEQRQSFSIIAGSLQEETMINPTFDNHTPTETSTSHMFTETMLKDSKHQSAVRSSISSGELLQNLESFYDHTRSSNSDSFKRQSDVISRNSNIVESKVGVPRIPLPQINDMTAGLDQTNDLPVMLYKVQDKNYDESKNRWSYYENRNSQNEKQSPPQPPIQEIPKKPEGAYTNNDIPISTRSAIRDSATHSSNESTTSLHQQIPHQVEDRLVLSQPKKNIILNEKQFNDLPYLPRQYEEKVQEYNIVYYPWLQFILLMLIGLIIPPIYLLITIGLFDDKFRSNLFYGGLRYYNNNKTNGILNLKKFSKAQKMISLVMFLFWVSAALAMIGVGIGLGLTRD
ncbi:unnamed protein product [Candida verbasci]|uniref:Uncharacterized protein n=1 Tax=Candida verbasci TaxID=1227364 RepID=A0A9W4TT43_9ASCO|nr:unnamed protein product [Candida verbasci]